MFHEHLLSYPLAPGRSFGGNSKKYEKTRAVKEEKTYKNISTDFTQDLRIGESIQVIILNLEIFS
jgi:hypothetical protein